MANAERKLHSDEVDYSEVSQDELATLVRKLVIEGDVPVEKVTSNLAMIREEMGARLRRVARAKKIP